MSKLASVPTADEVNSLIARRLLQFRRAQSLSLDALAARSEISKGMLVAIENGDANPSIGTLCKLAASLRVSVADLISTDNANPGTVRIVSPDQAKLLWEGPKGGRALLQVGTTGPDMLELWEWTIFPGEEFRSKGHPPGTREIMAVLEGTLVLEVDGADHLVSSGHQAISLTDRPHAYRCHGKKRTRFAMVVQEPGSAADVRGARP